MVQGQRERFQLPEGLHYLNCAYMSPLATSVEEAVLGGLRQKRDPSGIGSQHFFEPADGVRARFARLINASPERIAILPAVSYGVAIAARNLPVEAGQSIVVLGEQFPGNVHAWVRRAREVDAHIVRVPRPQSHQPGAAWNAAILEAITPATAVVALPPVHWTDGTRFDLLTISQRCRETGAALVVDGTQSVGALDFDVEQVQPDALITATYKWLMGPYGVALGWFGPRFDDGIPLEEGWINRAGSEDFGGLVDYAEAYQPGALRYDVGERSNFALLPGVSAGLDLIDEWTPAGICDHITGLIEPVLPELEALGFQLESPEWRAPHMFGLKAPSGSSLDTLQDELSRRQVSVSRRGASIRISPHVYNDETDIAVLLEALRSTVAPIR
jgi:selenocysteine lyase/cysteine desulfurase